ncbi:probable G-protein coupled receptor 139 [Chiloscyllium punctatum]|uniref:G-protein coupled receptors family 1 profile domain-containing protein n=1 Tax=Chiloscyllium punctatum TaxID=137246 RepID=A0A401RXP3_CHIPU|nr:hypothetical protein [Chiloscyllium punctatum]
MPQSKIILKIKHIYYPLLTAVGIPVNFLTILVLSRGKCGLSKCVSCYLVGMAMADLLVIIIDVMLNKIMASNFPLTFLHITPICALRRTILQSTTDASVWLTVTFTFDRFIAICCQNLKTKYCTVKTAVTVVGIVSVLSCLNNIPWYFTFESQYTINNVPWLCPRKSIYYTSHMWMIFAWFDVILTPCTPFFLILLLNAATVKHILMTSRVRKGLIGHNKATSETDPELEHRRKSIILLLSISGTFILLWMLHVLLFLYTRITNHYSYASQNDPLYILQQTGPMLLLLSCCTNTGIYAVTQAKFREELKNVVKYPLKLILKSIK